MDKQALLRLVAKVGRRKPAEISDHVSLASAGITKSIGLAALRSHIESQTGSQVGTLRVDMTIAELAELVANGNLGQSVPLGQTSSASPAPPSFPHPAPSAATFPAGIAIGLDLQDVAALPDADDLRTDPFYSAHFAPSELATALLRPDPRSHLCGVFSAKEAVKKSHPALLGLRMDALIVEHDVTGRPSLRFADPALQAQFSCSLSITHSAGFAAATCLTMTA
jgi:holo-[acyl-carrier protein] synthase